MTNWRHRWIYAAKTRGGGLFPGILGGGVPPGSPNPHPISDQKSSFSRPVFTAGACFSKVSATLRARKAGHVVWRDSVCVESSGSELKSECADIFTRVFWLLRHTDEPQVGRNSCLWLQSRSVLSSFGMNEPNFRSQA